MPAGRDDSAPNEWLPLTSNGELIKRGISLSAFCPPGDQIAKFPPAIQESEYKSNLRVRHNYKLRLQYITTSPYQSDRLRFSGLRQVSFQALDSK